jgi:2-methylisocitrate lyase-like PEP mutase family enzyme
MNKAQAEKAKRFFELHQGPEILVLPNAWDAITARLFEQAGFQALGTTSAGIAHSLGYVEPQKISREEMLSVIQRCYVPS